MRICMVTGSYPPQPCGVGDYSKRLVEELRRTGLDVDVVTTSSPGRERGAEVAYALVRWSVREWARAARWIRGRRYDLVHIQYPARFYGHRASLACLTLVLKAAGVHAPIVVTVHEFTITHFLRKLTVAAIASPASRVLMTAESERATMARMMPWIRPKLRVVNVATPVSVVPLDGARREEIRRSYPLHAGGVVIAFFGHLHPNKGIESLFESFSRLYARNRGVRLVMLSLFEPSSYLYHAALAERIRELGVEGGVIWPGYLDDETVSQHLASADIAFLPYQDGVSLRRTSFMTAMEHGLAVLTTTGKEPPEALGLFDGENVFLVRAGSPPEIFADRLEVLAGSAQLRSALGEQAKVWSAARGWHSAIRGTLAVYGELKKSVA